MLDTKNPDQLFSFLFFLSEGKELESIKSYDGLSWDEKKDVITFLETKKYGIWEEPHSITRTEAFINTYPRVNFKDKNLIIKKTNILIIGLGTAGSYVLEILIKLGYKKFTIIDGDIVEPKNLDAQNYSSQNIGYSKAKVIKEKYSDVACIKAIDKYVNSFYELEDNVTISSFDYIVNAADKLSLMQSLLTAKANGKLNGILIECGYGVLMQNIYMIDNEKKAENIKKALDTVVLDSERWIVSNNGSILNAIFSSFAIAKMILDRTIGLNNTETGFADFLQNRFFLGSNTDKLFFDAYSEKIQDNMVYKHIHRNNSIEWIPKITIDNVLSIKPLYDVRRDLTLYENEFLAKRTSNSFIDIAEYEASKLEIDNLSVELECEDRILQQLLSYIECSYGAQIKNRINLVLTSQISEKVFTNVKKQSKSIKVGGKWGIINTNFSNSIEKVISKIHEVFHIVYWEVTNNSYEHERFVMENELKFYHKICKDSKDSQKIMKYYLKNKLKLFAKNYTISHYEKAIITHMLPNFQIEFNDLTKYQLTEFVNVLNQQINYEKPFYLLKYLVAFERNQEYLQKIVQEVTERKGV